jgi:DEAD/DEAH box helicase domain-containing protein
VHVLTHVAGYKKIRFYTLENIGYGEVDLPDQEMHTTSAWWSFDEELPRRLGLPTPAFQQGLAGLGYALQHLAALRCLCDPADLGRAVADRDGRGERDTGTLQPVLFLYDRYPGGSGLAEGIFLRSGELLSDALELVSSCSCEAGCPSCVGPGGPEGAENPDADPKGAALRILAALVRSA